MGIEDNDLGIMGNESRDCMIIVYEEDKREIMYFLTKRKALKYLIKEYRNGDKELFEELKREDLLSLNAEFEKEYIQIEGINPGDPFYV